MFFFVPAKEEPKNLSLRLRGQRAVDYHPYTLFVSKNAKLTPKLSYGQLLRSDNVIFLTSQTGFRSALQMQ